MKTEDVLADAATEVTFNIKKKAKTYKNDTLSKINIAYNCMLKGEATLDELYWLLGVTTSLGVLNKLKENK